MPHQLSAIRQDCARPLKLSWPALVRLGTVVSLVCVLVSCGGEVVLVPPTIVASPPMATPPHAATPVQARVVREPSIDPVVWATSVDPASLAPAKAVTTLTSDALNIYACLSAINLAKGTIVDASWSYNNTSLDAFSTRLTLPDSAPQRWVTFHITRDPNVPWPPGTYAISVAVDGKVIQEASIEVTSTA